MAQAVADSNDRVPQADSAQSTGPATVGTPQPESEDDEPRHGDLMPDTGPDPARWTAHLHPRILPVVLAVASLTALAVLAALAALAVTSVVVAVMPE